MGGCRGKGLMARRQSDTLAIGFAVLRAIFDGMRFASCFWYKGLFFTYFISRMGKIMAEDIQA